MTNTNNTAHTAQITAAQIIAAEIIAAEIIALDDSHETGAERIAASDRFLDLAAELRQSLSHDGKWSQSGWAIQAMEDAIRYEVTNDGAHERCILTIIAIAELHA